MILGQSREDSIREAGVVDTEDTREVIMEVTMEVVRLLQHPDCRQHLDTELCDNETF